MGKSSKPTIGYWYKLAYHAGLGIGPIDAFLEFRGGDKTAWQGAMTASSRIYINQPNLWGGEKDQGGIVSFVDVMFGDADQVPSSYLIDTFGPQVPAWRGLATLIFLGGRYGANNPYPQPAAYKIRKIKQGWSGDGCWYPEKAEVPANVEDATTVLAAQLSDWRYNQVDAGDGTDYSAADFNDSSWNVGAAPFGSWEDGRAGGLPAAHTYDARFSADFASLWTHNTRLWLRRTLTLPGVPTGSLTIRIYIDDHCTIWVNGNSILTTPSDHDGGVGQEFTIATHHLVTGDNIIAVRCDDEAPSESASVVYVDMIFSASATATAPIYMNPAHVLYYSRTHDFIGREPTANINDDSLRAAADQLYAEGFGICPVYDPATESGAEFEQRICKLIGGSFTRSLVDGLWYLDLARGDYVLDDLPILNDDDILDFSEQPTILDSAANSVTVKYFDPVKKEDVITPPVQALGLIDAFGTITQVSDYPEIPGGTLAARIAERDLRQFCTPTRTFDLKTTRKPYAWRPNTYFRLQIPKRGIADMVCLLAEKSTGTLKSGAIAIKAVQDIFSLPSTSFVDVEPGVDPRPSQKPTVIALERGIEAPYVVLAGAMARADLDAVPVDAGFALAVAASTATDRDYTMMVKPDGGSYADAGNGSWAATATVNEEAAKGDTDFTLANGVLLDQVTIGMGVLWDDEVARVDAIDADAGTITLGRGCADTVPAEHAADSRLWFYEVGFAYDTTEYTDAEVVDVKLLSNTGSQQLPIASAAVLALTFDQRQPRPYPPGNVTIAGDAWPTTATGAFAVAWAHRDRVTQADQLVDTTAASIGPEDTTRYALQFYNDDTDALLVQKLDIGDDGAAVNLAASANVRMVLWSTSDLGDSWQKHAHVFAYTTAGGANTITADTYTPPAWIIDGNGGG